MMSSRSRCGLGLVLAGVAFAAGWGVRSTQAGADAPKPLFYELRTYTTVEGRLPALHGRFRDHTMKLFEKHGMKNVVYLTPVGEDNKLVYLLAHGSQEAAQKSFTSFRNDPEWVAARDASEKDGKIVAKVESVFFTPTDYSPMK